MAISKKINLVVNGGLEIKIDNAYGKISKIAGNKNSIEFFVNWKKDMNSDVFKSVRYDFVPNLEGKNFIAQAYEHLKSLPEFAGATDC